MVSVPLDFAMPWLHTPLLAVIQIHVAFPLWFGASLLRCLILATQCLCCVFWHVQWLDKEGRTPLILACTRGELLDMAMTLINLGADIEAYRPGPLTSYRDSFVDFVLEFSSKCS
jgi:hypothetical protein